MGVKVTVPNNSSDSVTFGSANTPTAAEVKGLDNGSSNGSLIFNTTASGTSAEKMRIDSTGNVGIGTASPNSKLTVAGNIEVRDASGVYLGDSTNVSFPSLYSPAINNIAFRLNSGAETIRIDSSGNVGIGTSSPSYALDVQSATTSGAGTITGNYNTASSGSSISTLRIRTSGTGASYWDINTGNTASGLNGAIRFFDNIAGAERMRIDSSGNVGIGTSSPGAKLEVSGGHARIGDGWSYQWGDGSSSINGDSTSDFIDLYTANTARMRITSAGGVSFGATGTAYGSSGQVLQSNGNAPPTWTTISSGGMTLLGTLTTTSGSTQTLSGLTLTNYKALFISFDRVSNTQGAGATFRFNSTTGPEIAPQLASAAGSMYGTCWVNLQQNGAYGSTTAVSATAGVTSGANPSYGGESGITTASTSVVFGTSAGTFDAGTIRVYGVS